VSAVWLLPAGPGRGATLTLLLTAALTAVTLRRLGRDGWRLSWTQVVPVAVALQVLWRADFLLVAQPQAAGSLATGALAATVFELLVLPCLGAVGVVVLASRWRPEAILTVTAASLVLGGGWSPIGVMTLLLVAALDRTWARRGQSPRLPIAAGTMVALALILLAWMSSTAHGWGDFLHLLSWLPILAPVAVIAGLEWPSRTHRLWQAKASRLWQTQALWSGSLLLGSTMLAGYPWLRDAPADHLLTLIGLEAGWSTAVVVVIAALVIGFNRWLRPATLGGLALFLALVLALPTAGRVVLRHRSLTAAAPSAGAQVEPAVQPEAAVPVATVMIDSYLSYGTLVAAGAPVARIRLQGANGHSEEWTLRNGRETGEWAARRPDIAASPTLETPPPWLSWVTAERRFFGQRYRAVHQLLEPFAVESVEVALEPGIAPDVTLTLVGLELRP